MREYSLRARLEMSVDDDAPIQFDACRLSKAYPRLDAEARNNEIGGDPASVGPARISSLNPRRSRAEMEANAMLLMQGPNELSHLVAKDALHRGLVRRRDMNLDLARPE